MHARLVSYLQDNRDQIIENWLTEAEVPPPLNSAGIECGVVPYAFFSETFDAVLQIIRQGPQAIQKTVVVGLDQFLGITCECKSRCLGGRICMELHDAGLKAFMGVFEESWDTEHEFSQLDRESSQDLINHALSGCFGQQIEHCPQKNLRKDCPFVANHLVNK